MDHLEANGLIGRMPATNLNCRALTIFNCLLFFIAYAGSKVLRMVAELERLEQLQYVNLFFYVNVL